MYDLVRQPAKPTAPVALKWFTDPKGHFLKELVPFDTSGGIAHDLPLFFDPENNVQVSFPPMAFGVAWYLVPISRELSRNLYVAALKGMGVVFCGHSVSHWFPTASVCGLATGVAGWCYGGCVPVTAAAGLAIALSNYSRFNKLGLCYRLGSAVAVSPVRALWSEAGSVLSAGGLVVGVVALAWAVQSVQHMWALLILSGALGASWVLLCICVAVTDGVVLIQLVLTLAIEFQDSATVAVIEPVLEQLAAPREFGDSCFGFFYHLDSDWPRGQLSALLMTAEFRGAGRWQNIFTNSNFRDRFQAPAVQDVAFPMVGLAKAQNCTESGWLLIQMYIASVPEWQVFDEAGETTAIRVIRVPSVGSGKVQVTCDGISYEYWEITGANEIRIQIQNPDCVLKVFTGYYGPPGPK